MYRELPDPVATRVTSIHRDYPTKIHLAEVRYNGLDCPHPRTAKGACRRRHPDTADGVTSSSQHPVGPAETACRAYALKALVVGAFGEASPDLLELMEQVANATATHHHRAYGYKSALAGRAPALATITRGLGMLVARLNAQLVLRRLVYVGDGPHAEEAVRRRGRARFRRGMWSDAEHYRPNARARTGA